MVKRSDRLEMEYVAHYRQAEGKDPRPIVVPRGYARVELVTGGRGWIEDAGGAWREVAPGDLLWNAAGEYTIGRSDFAAPYRCLAVTLKGAVPRPADVPRFTAVSDPEEARAFARETVALFRDPGFDEKTLSSYLVGRLLFWARLHRYRAGPERLPGPLRDIVTWIGKNLEGPCRVGEMARRGGWSIPHLHDLFRRHLGTTPHQYLLDRRLRAVQERLVATAQPVKRIAIECGFTDASSLNHFFRARLGLTPKAYRRRHAGLDLHVSSDPGRSGDRS